MSKQDIPDLLEERVIQNTCNPVTHDWATKVPPKATPAKEYRCAQRSRKDTKTSPQNSLCSSPSPLPGRREFV